METLTIGQVAARAKVHKETIRYYQSLGLVPVPPRPYGTVRRYGDATIARLTFIKRAQQLGFTLEEVGTLLQLEVANSCRETRELAEVKLEMINGRIADLNRMRRMLEGLVKECRQGGRPRSCPIITTLASDVAP